MIQTWEDLPSLPGWPWLGHWPALRRDTLAFMLELSACGPLARFKAGSQRCMLVSEPALIQKVLVDEAASFGREDMLRSVGRYLMGQGLLTSEGAEHSRQRALVKPAMAAMRLPDYLPAMSAIAEEQAALWARENSLELCQAMGTYTFRLASAALFGRDLGPESAQVVAGAVDRCSDAIRPATVLPLLGWFLRFRPSFQADKALIMNTVDALLMERPKDPDPALLHRPDAPLVAQERRTHGRAR